MSDESKAGSGGNGIAAMFQSFYTELVLRDLFGKVVPGTLILLAFAMSLTSLQQVLSVVASATLGVWLLAIGLAWLTGLSVQGVGELLWIRYYPRRLSLSSWQEKLVDFRNTATPKNERDFERFTVVAEACGNGSVALFLSILLVVGRGNSFGVEPRTTIVAFVSLVLALGGLIKLHFENVERRYGYIEKVLARSTRVQNQK